MRLLNGDDADLAAALVCQTREAPADRDPSGISYLPSESGRVR